MIATPAMATDAELDRVLDSVEQAFGRLFQSLRHRWKDAAEGLSPELQPIGFRIVSTLAMGGPMRAGALADLLSTDKSVLSRQLAHLEQLGLVERRADETDASAALLAVTSVALERLAALRASQREELATKLGHLPLPRLEEFADTLRQLADAV